MWHNLGEAVERTVTRHRVFLSAAVERPGEPLLPDIGEVAAGMRHGPVDPAQRRDRVAVRTRERYAQVHALLAEGQTIRAIGIRLGLARNTARRFARAQSPEELLVNNGTGYRVGLLDEFKLYLHRRWNEGCTNVTRLFEEIRARGYRGRASMVRAYLQQFRAIAHIPAPPPKPPAARRVAAWIMTDPAALDPDDQQRLDAILASSPELDSLAGHVRAFATMMTELKGKQLEQWMSCVDADDQPALHSFVRGLRRDQDAVTAGLTMRWSSGAVEGHVNRIILWNLKCQVCATQPCVTATIGSWWPSARGRRRAVTGRRALGRRRAAAATGRGRLGRLRPQLVRRR